MAEAKTVGNTGFQGSAALTAMAKYGSHSEEVFFRDYEAVKNFIPTIKTPVCHIFVSDDLLYYDFKSSNEYAMYNVPGAKFVMLQGEKHLMEMDMPKLLAREVLFFIEGTTLKYELFALIRTGGRESAVTRFPILFDKMKCSSL